MGTRRVVNEHGSFTLFFTIASPFSNFYPCEFEGQSMDQSKHKFNCVEHYYMYNKALSANDLTVAEKILKETDPKKIKALGSQIANFNQAAWDVLGPNLMQTALSYKYTQNQHLRYLLFLTTTSRLVECSPTDVKWGIGLSIEDPKASIPSMWRGKNALGQLMTAVRELLWIQPEYAAETAAVTNELRTCPEILQLHFTYRPYGHFTPHKPQPISAHRCSSSHKRRSRRSPSSRSRSRSPSRKRRRSPSPRRRSHGDRDRGDRRREPTFFKSGYCRVRGEDRDRGRERLRESETEVIVLDNTEKTGTDGEEEAIDALLQDVQQEEEIHVLETEQAKLEQEDEEQILKQEEKELEQTLKQEEQTPLPSSLPDIDLPPLHSFTHAAFEPVEVEQKKPITFRWMPILSNISSAGEKEKASGTQDPTNESSSSRVDVKNEVADPPDPCPPEKQPKQEVEETNEEKGSGSSREDDSHSSSSSSNGDDEADAASQVKKKEEIKLEKPEFALSEKAESVKKEAGDKEEDGKRKKKKKHNKRERKNSRDEDGEKSRHKKHKKEKKSKKEKKKTHKHTKEKDDDLPARFSSGNFSDSERRKHKKHKEKKEQREQEHRDRDRKHREERDRDRRSRH